MTVAYFGDGAASEGDAHAAFNFAATLEVGARAPPSPPLPPKPQCLQPGMVDACGRVAV